MTIATLTTEYDAWLKASDLTPMSADELHYELLIKRERINAQIVWLESFQRRWEATQAAEDAASSPAFLKWQASRVAVPDFADGAYSHAMDFFKPDRGTIGGYGYEAGCWIQDRGEGDALGRYWCPASNAEYLGNDLAEAELFLWMHHASYEVGAAVA